MITTLYDINLRPFNTFRISASCSRFIEYTSIDDIPAVVASLSDKECFLNIGAGSNMLFTSDYMGTILHSKILDVSMSCADSDYILVKAGSGVTMDELIEQCSNSGVWGMENLSGIPGEVGAAAVQNVGAYGVEACDIIDTIECYDIVGQRFVRFNVSQCGYAYRHSMFKLPENKYRYIISSVTFRLYAKHSPKIEYGSLKNEFSDSDIETLTPRQVRDAIIKVRNSKLPLVDEIGSAGSFFKNPVVSKELFNEIKGKNPDIPFYNAENGIKIPAAWLIDQCGFKGFKHGGAAVWHKQPLVIVNNSGQATSSDIIELENIIIDKVKSKFGVELSPEVEHI